MPNHVCTAVNLVADLLVVDGERVVDRWPVAARGSQPLTADMMSTMDPGEEIVFEWRGEFGSTEVNALHAEAFGTRVFGDDEWNWRDLVERHSLGWVVARRGGALVGFVNVPSDGFTHAWIQDTMVSAGARGLGIGTNLVKVAREGARAAGCEWLHVDFDDDLGPFYFDACGFTPTNAGLIRL